MIYQILVDFFATVAHNLPRLIRVNLELVRECLRLVVADMFAVFVVNKAVAGEKVALIYVESRLLEICSCVDMNLIGVIRVGIFCDPFFKTLILVH